MTLKHIESSGALRISVCKIRHFKLLERYDVPHYTKTKNTPSLLYLNSSIATTDADKALLYNEYFHSMYTNTLSTLPDMNTFTSDVEPLQPFDISELNVYSALINLRRSQ